MINIPNPSKNRNSFTSKEAFQNEELKVRKNDYEEKRVKSREYNSAVEKTNGWYEFGHTNTCVKLRRDKQGLVCLENRLWNLFYKFGFHYLNRQDHKKLYFGEDEGKSITFSLFGKDDYAFIAIDCFTKDNINTFRDKVTNTLNNFDEINDYIKTYFNDNLLIFKYIIFVKDVKLSAADEQLVNKNTVILDNEDIIYFENLYSQIKGAAYYQLCGKIFEGITIPKIETKIPAIKGRMGGHIYYAFSIDPKILLRLSYVLHKTKANEESMPTYQRLVKGSRLRGITDFLNRGGYFPNSIVVNLDDECKFEAIESKDEDCNIDTEVGYLTIPQKYRVAYIIDGQHRLLAYADCNKANQQVPVVAFQKLDKVTQVKLFMDMNQNQKAVPKELRLVLIKDLLQKSDRLSQKMIALRLQIAYAFTDNVNSPLYGYVGNGEDKHEYTLNYIDLALQYSKVYFGEIIKDELKEPGIFYKKDTDESFENTKSKVRDFLFICVRFYIESLNGVEILCDNPTDNVFLRNIAMQGYLRFIADLVAYKKSEIISDNPEDVFNIIRPYMGQLVQYIQHCPAEEGVRLKERRGQGAPIQYQRTFQREVNNVYNDFNPSGLDKWKNSNSDEIVNEALELIKLLYKIIEGEFTTRFSEKVDVDNWVNDSLPNEVYSKCITRKGEFERHATNEEIRGKTVWDFIKEEDYYDIAVYAQNDPLIKDDFSDPSLNKRAKKSDRYAWINKITVIEEECNKNHSCQEDSIELLRKMYNHFRAKDMIPEEVQENID